MEIVRLNVGGTLFATTREVLSKAEFFNTFLSGEFSQETLPDGAFFIDRDPTYFGDVLHFLRTGTILFSKHSLESFSEFFVEASFFGVRIGSDIFRDWENCRLCGVFFLPECGYTSLRRDFPNPNRSRDGGRGFERWRTAPVEKWYHSNQPGPCPAVPYDERDPGRTQRDYGHKRRHIEFVGIREGEHPEVVEILEKVKQREGRRVPEGTNLDVLAKVEWKEAFILRLRRRAGVVS